MPYYPPFNVHNHSHASDEEAIRCEASLLIEDEFHRRSAVKWDGLEVPPRVEEMKFDGDRGL